MRLSELEPRWLLWDGKRVGFTFRCPHCADKPLGHDNTNHGCYLSCFLIPMAHIAGPDGQYSLIKQTVPEEFLMDVVPCRRGFAWASSVPADQADFSSLTITPSLDASASGHWHGFITNGEIK